MIKKILFNQQIGKAIYIYIFMSRTFFNNIIFFNY